MIRNGAQLFFDRLQQSARPRFSLYGQEYRKQAGKPTHRAGKVQLGEQVLPAMAFQIDQHRVVPAPAANYLRQGGEQTVIVAGSINWRDLLQQGLGVLFAEGEDDFPGAGLDIGSFGIFDGERRCRNRR